MGRRRGFLPPAQCHHCGKAPDLGQTLWPGDHWRCVTCLEDTLPGKDITSKSMFKMLEHQRELNRAFELESQGATAEEPRNRAEWARRVAAELYNRGTARSTALASSKGEAVPPHTEPFLRDTLTCPDLAAVEASFDRSRLLLGAGTDVAAMGVDAADSIQARNSLEKMLAHQLAATHKLVMEQMGMVYVREERDTQAKRLTAIARCLTAYQQGLLTLRKLRQNGNQRILVQYVNVSEGGQAVIGNVGRGSDENTA